MYLLSALLLGVTAKGVYSYVPQKARENMYIKILDLFIAVREACSRCTHPSVAVTSVHYGNLVLTSYVYTNEDSVVYPKYSLIGEEMVPFREISELCEEMEERMHETHVVHKEFGMALLIVNDTVAIQIQQLFNALAGPTKDFRNNHEICLHEAICFVDDRNFNPLKDRNFYLRLYMVDGSEWKVTDLNTKLADLLNLKENEGVIKVKK
jgi:hypothetical protein